MATNRDRILQFVHDFPGRDDDTISLTLRILPRQSVNMVCRELEKRGLITRKPGVTGKISNFPRTAAKPAVAPATTKAQPDTEGEQVPAPPHRALLTIERLENGGFSLTARWRLSAANTLETDSALPKHAGVYAFVIGESARYVGVAMMGLAKRLHFYARPGATQKTSQRLNRQLIEELTAGRDVQIYTAQPPDLSWNGLPVSGPAGLEIGLIKTFSLPWNIRGV